jgi:hypothetical protein
MTRTDVAYSVLNEVPTFYSRKADSKGHSITNLSFVTLAIKELIMERDLDLS